MQAQVTTQVVWTSTSGDYGVDEGAPTGQETDFYIGTDINGFDVGVH
ncbi:MAG: hypothetical protein ACJZ9L_01395 [Coraliomargaritaceae bacterium]